MEAQQINRPVFGSIAESAKESLSKKLLEIPASVNVSNQLDAAFKRTIEEQDFSQSRRRPELAGLLLSHYC